MLTLSPARFGDCVDAGEDSVCGLRLTIQRSAQVSASTNMRDFAQLPGLDPALEFLPDLGIGGFSHAARQRCFKDRAAVLHSRSLEDMIARPRHGLPRLNLWLRHLVLPMLERLRDDAVGMDTSIKCSR